MVVAFATRPLAAQDKHPRDILGRDNVAYGRLLLNAGFTDFAQGVCDAIEAAKDRKPPLEAVELIAVRPLRLDLQLRQAAREPDLIKRLGLYKTVLQEKLKFIEEFTRTPTAQEVRNDLPDTYRLIGETITQALQKEQDPSAAAGLRTDGQDMFSQAEASLQERIKQFQAIITTLATDDKAVAYAERQLTAARFGLAQTYYFHSLLFAKDDPKKAELLDKAIDSFGDFSLAYGDSLLNFQGYIFQGLCHRDLSAYEDALGDFDAAIGLRDTYDKATDKPEVYDMPSDAADLVSQAVLQKVLVLADHKDVAAVNDVAKDFFTTTPDALYTTSGLAVLAAQADARLGSGDIAGAGEIAQQLVDADADGPWGARGRDILSKSIGNVAIGPERLLKIARTQFDRGAYEKALDVYTQARVAAKGSPKEADVGAESFLFAGAIYSQLERNHEAAAAWDAAVDQYPNGELAPDALWQAIGCYQTLHATERQPFYKKRMDERMRLLTTKYPKSPFASQGKLIEGKELEGDKEYLKAAEAYQQMRPGTSGYEEGQYRAGKCYFDHARNLASSGKPEDAKNFFAKSEEMLKRTQSVIEQTLATNLSAEVQAGLGKIAFQARVSLAQLLLQPSVGRAAEVLPLLADVEQKYPGDQAKLAQTWTLRIQALQAQGQLAEAVKLLESLRQKNPDAPGLASAAGIIAGALDAGGATLLEKDPKSAEGEKDWRDAAQYYMLSLRPWLADSTIAPTENIKSIADRFVYVFAAHFNKVPDEYVNSFVGYTEKPPAEPYFYEQAELIYRAMLERAPSSKASMSLGRVLGFLARWRDAADIFAREMDKEQLFDQSGTRFTSAIKSSKPELIYGYLEWGVAERNAAVADNKTDAASLKRASTIFERMVSNTNGEKETKLYWQSKYYQIRCWMDQGKYDVADVAVAQEERTTNDFDGGKYGYKEKFQQLKAELSKKVFKNK